MGAKDVRAGGAFIELFAKDSAVQATLLKNKKAFQDFGSSIRNIGLGATGLGLALAAPLAAAVQSFTTNGAAIDDMAQRTGLTSDAVQELSHAAVMSATDIETLEKGLAKMQRTVAEAGEGTLEARKALNDMGTSFQELKKLSPDKQFEKMADGIMAIKDPAQRTAAAMAVFGKGGAALIPLLSQGSGAIEKFRAEARSMGLVLDGDAIQAAAKLDDGLQTLYESFGAIKNQIGAVLAGPALAFVELVTNGAQAIAKFISQNRGLVIGVTLAAGALMAGGIALIGVGTAISIVGTALAGLATLWGAVGAAIAAVAGSPLLIVIGLLGGLVAIFPQLRAEASGVLEYLFGGFMQLGEIFGDTFQGIMDALQAGDMTLAVNILWAGVHAAWLQGTANIRQVWRTAINGIASMGLDAFAALRAGWEMTVKFFSDVWDMAVGGMGGTWSDLQTLISQSILNASAKIEGGTKAEIVAREKAYHESLKQEKDATKEATAARMAARKAETDAKFRQIEQDRQDGQKGLADDLAAQNKAAQDQIEIEKAKLRDLKATAATAKNDKLEQRKRDTLGALSGSRTDGFLTNSIGSFSASAAARSTVAGVSPLLKGVDETAKNTADTVAALNKMGGLEFA